MATAAVILAGLVSFGWGALAIRRGAAWGYVDVPDDELKPHVVPAVPLGGVGVFLGVHSALLVSGNLDGWLLAGTTILLGLGLADDRLDLNPVVRLGVETLAGIVLGLGAAGASWHAALIAILVVVAVNAVNLFDGLDGLAAGAGVFAALGVSWLAMVGLGSPTFGLILAAALVGFLRWNWHPAHLFLGDNGAYVLGGLLAYGIASVASGSVELMVEAGILGVFLLDLVVTVLRRASRGNALFGGDRMHLYDRLAAAGLAIPVVVGIAVATQIALVAVTILSVSASYPLAVAGAALVLAVGAAMAAAHRWLP